MPKIFKLKKKEQAVRWQKIHNGELHNSYSSPNIICGDKIKEGDM
jgi:hypothetical protein